MSTVNWPIKLQHQDKVRFPLCGRYTLIASFTPASPTTPVFPYPVQLLGKPALFEESLV